MTEKSSKLVVAVELLYVLVKCSLHFWGWLVTGGFIYGWVSSHKKLVFCVDHPEALQEKLCRLTKKLPPAKKCYLWAYFCPWRSFYLVRGSVALH